jgi:hypothetical protein
MASKIGHSNRRTAHVDARVVRCLRAGWRRGRLDEVRTAAIAATRRGDWQVFGRRVSD